MSYMSNKRELFVRDGSHYVREFLTFKLGFVGCLYNTPLDAHIKALEDIYREFPAHREFTLSIDGEGDLAVYGVRPETAEEECKRLTRNARKAENEKRMRERSKIEREDKERREYMRLKKKFANCDLDFS